MKNQFAWASALVLAIGAALQVETKAAYTNANGTIITNGTIIITTDAAGDGHFFLQSSSTIDDMDDNRGPGYAPGDAAMGELVMDNGYSVRRLIPSTSFILRGLLQTRPPPQRMQARNRVVHLPGLARVRPFLDPAL